MFEYKIICTSTGKWQVGLHLKGGGFSVESEYFSRHLAEVRACILNGVMAT